MISFLRIHVYACVSVGTQGLASDPLEQELQVAGNHPLWVTGMNLGALKE